MKFLCDVHISYKFSKFLSQQGFDCIHVNTILDKWYTKDIDISAYVDSTNRILITKDVDFKNEYFVKKTIRIILGNTSNSELISQFSKHLPQFRNLNTTETFFVEMGNDLTVY